ncbi:hypothetical protein OAA06_00445 [bacterium]|nr:hypothetical protein [bacterium]
MKLFTTALALLVTLGLWAQDEELTQYTVKSGHIEYTMSGSTKGTRSLWWDDFGDKSYEETNATTVIKMFGMENKEVVHNVTITVGDKYWSANLLDNTGESGTYDYKDAADAIAKSMTEEEAKKLEQQMLDALNGEKLGKETFLGKSCEVLQILGTNKIWVYKGIALKTNAQIMGIVANEAATKFEENISVPSSKFTPLKTISYTAQ